MAVARPNRRADDALPQLDLPTCYRTVEPCQVSLLLSIVVLLLLPFVAITALAHASETKSDRLVVTSLSVKSRSHLPLSLIKRQLENDGGQYDGKAGDEDDDDEGGRQGAGYNDETEEHELKQREGNLSML